MKERKHCRLDAFDRSKEPLRQLREIQVVYQKVSDEKLYITGDDPRDRGDA